MNLLDLRKHHFNYPRHFDFIQVNDDVIEDLCFSFIKGLQDYYEQEKFIFFYHKDHLGSSTQISDRDAKIIHHPDKFVSKSFYKTLETTNSGLVWILSKNQYSHNFSNYESRLNVEYMPTGEQFSEQRDWWSTPYKFNGKELDAETGLYYYGARYYTPEIGIWLSACPPKRTRRRMDPMADKYPHQSPFMFCSGNPVVRVDMDGMEDEVFITGFYAEDAFQDLQASTSLKLSRNEDNGRISITGGEVQNDNDQQLMDAINCTNVSVNLDTSPDFETAGSFMGTTYTENSSFTQGDKSGAPFLDITQSVSTFNVATYPLLADLEPKDGSRRGSGAKHEITEGYQAGLISLSLRRSLGPALVTEKTINFNGNPIIFQSRGKDYDHYDAAHGRATLAPNGK